MGERGDEWELQRIGTESEKMHVERELQELRERLSQVEQWKARHEEIEKELNKVWVEGGEEISPPPYIEKEEDTGTTITTGTTGAASEGTGELVAQPEEVEASLKREQEEEKAELFEKAKQKQQQEEADEREREDSETTHDEFEEATQGEMTETEFEDATETEAEPNES